jgi:hypothetical protein
MLQKHLLTNEALKKGFHDNFELTQFVINVARQLIKSGHEVDVPALLKDIQRNPSHYSKDHLARLEENG